MNKIIKSFYTIAIAVAVMSLYNCKPQGPKEALMGGAAAKAYVAPGQYDEFYSFVSGGFNGQIGVYGVPSGRLLKILPVFSVFPEN